MGGPRKTPPFRFQVPTEAVAAAHTQPQASSPRFPNSPCGRALPPHTQQPTESPSGFASGLAPETRSCHHNEVERDHRLCWPQNWAIPWRVQSVDSRATDPQNPSPDLVPLCLKADPEARSKILSAYLGSSSEIFSSMWFGSTYLGHKTKTTAVSSLAAPAGQFCSKSLGWVTDFKISQLSKAQC